MTNRPPTVPSGTSGKGCWEVGLFSLSWGLSAKGVVAKGDKRISMMLMDAIPYNSSKNKVNYLRLIYFHCFGRFGFGELCDKNITTATTTANLHMRSSCTKVTGGADMAQSIKNIICVKSANLHPSPTPKWAQDGLNMPLLPSRRVSEHFWE